MSACTPDTPAPRPVTEPARGAVARGAAARGANRVAVAWRSLAEDLRRWPFELVVNVVLASPLVPRLVRVALLRALGMPLRSLDVYPRCRLRSRKLRVGKGSVVNTGCHLDNEAWIELGINVQVAMNVTFVTTGHRLGPRERRAGPLQPAPIVVGDGTWIGAGAVILPGVTIGAGCVIAAGSVVRDDCAPNGLYSGVPAERIDRTRGRMAGRIAVAGGGG